MDPEWLAALAASGGTVLVQAMATDAWKAVRSGLARVFQRGDKKRAELVLRELDQDQQMVIETAESDRERASQHLIPTWQGRLAELLRAEPQLAVELRDLLDDVGAQLPATSRMSVQYNSATNRGTTYGVQGGVQQVIHNSPADQGEV